MMESNTSPYLNAQDTRLLSTEQSVRELLEKFSLLWFFYFLGSMLEQIVEIFLFVYKSWQCRSMCKYFYFQQLQWYLIEENVGDQTFYPLQWVSHVRIEKETDFKKENERRRKACAVWQREKWDEKE